MAVDPADRVRAIARLERLRASGEARRIRRSVGISARYLAKQLGVTAASLLAWEKGQKRPRPEVALRWLAALDAIKAEEQPGAVEEEDRRAS
jgi:transcriptional regulator with XRE-family HTH domain